MVGESDRWMGRRAVRVAGETNLARKIACREVRRRASSGTPVA